MAAGKSTIVDVAARARVSVGTVSHVLSGSTPVSDRLRARVLEAVEKLSFVPNHAARGLRGRRTHVIGLCLPHLSTAYPSKLSEVIEQLAARDGYSLLHVFSRHNPDTELRRMRELLSYRVDGLIVFPTSTTRDPLDLVYKHKVPTVLVDRPPDETRFDQVITNNVQAIQKGVETLTAWGHSNLLFICRSPDNIVTRNRIEGLRAALRRAKGRLTVRRLEIGDEENALRDGLTRLFLAPAPPTAIIASNSRQAGQVLTQLHALGIACPGRVSLLAFDDPEWAEIVTPRLSVIRQQAAEVARQAWEMLMRRIENPRAKTKRVSVEVEIQLRESVAAPPRPAARDGRERAARKIPARP